MWGEVGNSTSLFFSKESKIIIMSSNRIKEVEGKLYHKNFFMKH